MRKRIVIAVIVTAGGIAAVVFRPWESQLDYHKRKYLIAIANQIERPLFDRVTGRLAASTGQTVDTGRRHEDAFEKHAARLIALGYLERRAFWVSGEPLLVAEATLKRSERVIPKERGRFAIFTMGTQNGRNVLGLTAPQRDMPKWEELIREADVPESN